MRFILFLTAAMFAFSISAQSAERFIIPLNQKLNLTDTPVHIQKGDLSIRIDAERPLSPFKKILFKVHISENGQAVRVSDALLKFNMKMDMGRFHYPLKYRDGTLSADVILPKCITGDRLWFLKLEFEYNGRDYAEVCYFYMDR